MTWIENKTKEAGYCEFSIECLTDTHLFVIGKLRRLDNTIEYVLVQYRGQKPETSELLSYNNWTDIETAMKAAWLTETWGDKYAESDYR